MNSYRNRDQRIADEFTTEHGKCTKCGAVTTTEHLNTFGAQCGGCFARYCVEINTGRKVPRTPQERRELFGRLGQAFGRTPGAKEQAELLRRREAEGGQMGPPQLWVLKCCEDKLFGRVLPEAA